MPSAGLFKESVKPASLPEPALKSSASETRNMVLSSIRSQGPEFDAELRRKTLDEVEKNGLEGPFEVHRLPPNSVVSTRFGIKEGDKIRMIDDFSGSCVNNTVTRTNSPQPRSTDVLAALAVHLMRTSQEPLEGRTHDLKSAYRQLAVSPDSNWCSYIAFFDAEAGRTLCYRMQALPLGACRSVYSFLRVVHSLWWIGVRALRLTWCCFFDDFISICRDGDSSSHDASVVRLFRLLGWKYADGGGKAAPFRACFEALGISVDVSNAHQKFRGLCSYRKEILRVVGRDSQHPGVRGVVAAARSQAAWSHAVCRLSNLRSRCKAMPSACDPSRILE